MASIKKEAGAVAENIASARTTFSSALQEYAISRQDDSFDDVDIKMEPPDWTTGLSAFGNFSTKAVPRRIRPQPRRKKKREEPNGADTGTYHHTYVMRMFDRSVDLAQFPENTTLYPVARAWLRNEPNNKTLAIKTADDEPAITEEPTDDEQNPNYVFELPMPEPCTRTSHPRVPDPLPPEYTEGQSPLENMDGQELSTEKLFDNHMVRWKKVRQRWRNAAKEDDKRYSESFAILRTMHAEALEKQEQSSTTES